MENSTRPAQLDDSGYRARALITARVAAVAGILFILVVAFRGAAHHVVGWAFLLVLYVITLANYRYWIVRAGVQLRPRHLLFLG